LPRPRRRLLLLRLLFKEMHFLLEWLPGSFPH
jgi:hypothetical protein